QRQYLWAILAPFTSRRQSAFREPRTKGSDHDGANVSTRPRPTIPCDECPGNTLGAGNRKPEEYQCGGLYRVQRRTGQWLAALVLEQLGEFLWLRRLGHQHGHWLADRRRMGRALSAHR